MANPETRHTPANPGTLPTVQPRQLLLQARIFWFAMVAGVTIMGAVFTFLILAEEHSPEVTQSLESVAPILFYVGIGLTGLALLLGPFLRGQIFKAGWVGDIVKPSSYFAGNIIAWALCEGAVLYGLIVCFVVGSLWPYVLPPAVAYIFLLLLWPNGRAMFPLRDRYAPGAPGTPGTGER